MTIAELLVQATATLTTASTPDGLVWCKRSECLAEARAIVVDYERALDEDGDCGEWDQFCPEWLAIVEQARELLRDAEHAGAMPHEAAR